MAGRQISFLPTEREIRKQTAKIRKTWSELEFANRRRNFEKQYSQVYTRNVRVHLSASEIENYIKEE